MGIWVIEPSGRLYDSIAFSLLNKAFRLSSACIRLVEGRFFDEAYGLSRSIFECALNLRYLTLDRDEICRRSSNYVDFFHAERVHFLALLRKHVADKTQLDLIELRVKEERIEALWGTGKPKRLTDWKTIEDREWNGWKIVSEKHPLDDELGRLCDIQKLYAVEWRASSAMVHCSIRSLDNTFAVGRFAFKAGENLTTHYDHSFEPLLVTVVCLFLSARYALYGANLEDNGVFDELIEKTSKKLRYKRQS